MSALPQVSTLSVSYDPYVRQGWHLCPIPPLTKGPKLSNWNKKENTVTDPNMIPPNYGVGLCHAYSGTMALDIDDWDRAVYEFAKYDIDLPALYAAPDAVIIDSGREGHGKLLYAMPFGMSLTSKKLIETMPDGSKKNYIDFRCATASGLTVQDVLPPTIHPITGKPYQWAGKGDWRNLPQIPQALLDVWQSLLAKDLERTIMQHGSQVHASWDEVKQALDHINPDINRDEWVSIGMALHYAGHSTNQIDQALMLWDEWSSQGTKYKGQQDIMNCWRSFKPDPSGVKLGTLFHYATQAGWTRPVPDVSSLFKEVIPQSPKGIIDGMVIKPPVCRMDYFPQILNDRGVTLGHEFAADPLVPVFAGLAAIQAAADARIRLRLSSSWTVPPIIWTMTVGSPSAKKSAAAKPMIAVLEQIEAEAHPQYMKECLKFEALDAAYTASKKAYLQAASDPHNMLSGTLDTENLPIVLPQPPKPVPLKLMVSDITSQKLVRMCAERPRGLVCYLDEMRGWLDKLFSPGSGENRSAWVQSYDASRYSMERVGDGDQSASHFAVGIFGSIQPKTLKAAMSKLVTDGLVQRFMFIVLSDHFSDVLPDPSYHDPIRAAQWDEIVRRVYTVPVTEYSLSEGALEAFTTFQKWFIRTKLDERLIQASDTYIEAIGKIEGTCGRLMLLYHLIEDPFNPFVSESTAIQAINLTRDYLIPSARYIYGEIAGIDAGSIDQWVLDHIISYDQSTITLSDIKRSAKRKIEGIDPRKADAMILDAMAILEEAGWAVMLEQTHKSTKWAINPIVQTIDKAYKQEVLQAKQRLADHLHQTSGGRIPKRTIKGLE